MAQLDTWLQIIRDEYLSDYIPSGGSAVKFLSGTDDHYQRLKSDLCAMAGEAGCFFVSLDPSELDENGQKPDLHRIDKMFFAVTRRVDWRAWAEKHARGFLRTRGLSVPSGAALNDVDAIAMANGRDANDLTQEYQRDFATPMIRDHSLTVEFRSAITGLGRAQLFRDSVTPTTESVLLEWMAGRKVQGGAASLKKIGIYTPINPSNARYLLASFSRWLPQVDYSGLAVLLDFRAYEYKRTPKTRKNALLIEEIRQARARNASGEEIDRLMHVTDCEPPAIYSEIAYMQMLELLRHFIDEIDHFERLLLVTFSSPAFYDPVSVRYFGNYDALQTRIGLEVHPDKHDNPAAALVKLKGDA